MRKPGAFAAARDRPLTVDEPEDLRHVGRMLVHIHFTLRRAVLLSALTLAQVATGPAAFFGAAPTFAHEVTVGDLQIIHPYIPQPAASAKTAGGYMAIINSGTEADRLLGVESDIAAKVMLHESKVDADGIGTMAHVSALEIPAGGTVSLEPGGLHVMFMGLDGPLVEGETHAAVLIFEMAGRVEVEFMIDPAAGAEGQDGMDHGNGAHAQDRD
jgi:periplasmic copper chaperone A